MGTTMTKEEKMAVAGTILNQMGGAGRIRVMTGAKAFWALDCGLHFEFPNRQRSRGNLVKIELQGDDTYTVRFFNKAKGACKLVKEVEGVYCDQLKSIFEKQTGLYLSL